jgi:hypothetical protein
LHNEILNYLTGIKPGGNEGMVPGAGLPEILSKNVRVSAGGAVDFSLSRGVGAVNFASVNAAFLIESNTS